jgi:hypothetical protein
MAAITPNRRRLSMTAFSSVCHVLKPRRVDRDVLAQPTPKPTRLGEALTALAAAAVVLRTRVVPRVLPWTVIGQFTHGRLVGPAAPG